MRKDFGSKTWFMPLPVTIIGTYDENGVPNAMNAAWSTVYDHGKVFVSLGKHKTTENFKVTNAFTLSFATKATEVESDFFGIASGKDMNKIEKAGFHAVKSDKVNAPLFEEYPLTLECTIDSFEDGNLVGNIIKVLMGKVIVGDATELARVLENNSDHSIRGQMGKSPSAEIEKAILELLV